MSEFDFLSDKSITERNGNKVTLKPLDYYEKQLDCDRKELSRYCLSFINDQRWGNIPNHIEIILDGWVIYKRNMNDTDIYSDEWFLKWLEERFKISDLCSRSIYIDH